MSIKFLNSIAVTSIIVLSGLPLNSIANPNKISDNIVKIGVLTDMTGIFSDLGGQGSAVATKMAIDDFISQVKPNFRVEMITADHQNKPDIGANKAREWYDTQKVDLIVDAINSAVALAVSSVARDKRRLLIVTGAGTLRLTNEECSPYTISYAWDTYATSRPQTTAITKAGARDWYFIAVDYALGQSIALDAQSAVKNAGGKVVGSVRHPSGTTDFSSYMLSAQASKAQAIGIASAGGDLINAIKAAKEFGVTRNQRIVPLSGSITDVHALGLNDAQGIMLSEAFYWDLNEKTRAWSNRFHEQHKRMPNLINAGTYSAVSTYLHSVHATGTDDATVVREHLGNIKINDIFASNGYIRADGRMVHDMYLVEVKKPSESKRPWDYFNLKAIIPGAEAFQPLSESRCSLIKSR